VPRTVEDLRRTERTPDAEAVFSAVHASDEVLTGLLLGAAIISAACAPVLTLRGGVSGGVLAMIVAVALLLRGRLFLTVHQRLPLLTAGVAELAAGVGVLSATLPVEVRAVAVTVALLVVAGTVAAAGLAYSRRPPSPYLGRIGDVLDTVLVISVIPLACGVVGLYSYARGLAG
jgi:type VII secretion integral membrane protein EccD